MSEKKWECPFCGSDSVSESLDDEFKGKCFDCKACGPENGTPKTALKAFTFPKAFIERLREAAMEVKTSYAGRPARRSFASEILEGILKQAGMDAGEEP